MVLCNFPLSKEIEKKYAKYNHYNGFSGLCGTDNCQTRQPNDGRPIFLDKQHKITVDNQDDGRQHCNRVDVVELIFQAHLIF